MAEEVMQLLLNVYPDFSWALWGDTFKTFMPNQNDLNAIELLAAQENASFAHLTV